MSSIDDMRSAAVAALLVLFWFTALSAQGVGGGGGDTAGLIQFYPSPNFTLGINFTNAYQLSAAARTAWITQLEAISSPEVRTSADTASLSNSLSTLTALHAAGIPIHLSIKINTDPAMMNSGAVPRAAVPPYTSFSIYGLTQLNVTNFTAIVTNLLSQLDSLGITVTDFELGNEINNPQFNGDFNTPGTGTNYTTSDLSSVPEAETVASGFAIYASALAAFKTAVAATTHNSTATIVSAGLANPGAAGANSGSLDWVTINATLLYLRTQGADSSVGAYGIHIYEGAKASASTILSDLQNNALTECNTTGIPCQITEWGMPLTSYAGVDCVGQDLARLPFAYRVMNTVNMNYSSAFVTKMFWYDIYSTPYQSFVCGQWGTTAHLVIGR